MAEMSLQVLEKSALVVVPVCPKQERARHQKLRSKSGTGSVVKKAENLLFR
jgi:predicted GNAT family acetyltransferase